MLPIFYIILSVISLDRNMSKVSPAALKTYCNYNCFFPQTLHFFGMLMLCNNSIDVLIRHKLIRSQKCVYLTCNTMESCDTSDGVHWFQIKSDGGKH